MQTLLSAGLSPCRALQLKIAFAIQLTARRWRVATAAAPVGLAAGSDLRMTALYYIDAAPKGLTQTELADLLQISGPSMSRQLDKLEALGLVSRRRLLGDGRVKLIFLEPAGRRALVRLDEEVSALRERLFDGIPEADMAVVSRVMDTLSLRLAGEIGALPKQP
ncbi:MAG: MarR family transcriptional regulator [Brevundimonas sp.]|nr:MAG: MarR family transcriptional regulator [Brevundimonas sp.]